MTVTQSSLHPRATELVDEFTQWRHHLHAHPETAFEEKLTSAFIAQKLQSFGLDVKTGIARTGVVATLHGKRVQANASAFAPTWMRLISTKPPICPMPRNIRAKCMPAAMMVI